MKSIAVAGILDTLRAQLLSGYLEVARAKLAKTGSGDDIYYCRTVRSRHPRAIPLWVQGSGEQRETGCRSPFSTCSRWRDWQC